MRPAADKPLSAGKCNRFGNGYSNRTIGCQPDHGGFFLLMRSHAKPASQLGNLLQIRAAVTVSSVAIFDGTGAGFQEQIGHD